MLWLQEVQEESDHEEGEEEEEEEEEMDVEESSDDSDSESDEKGLHKCLLLICSCRLLATGGSCSILHKAATRHTAHCTRVQFLYLVRGYERIEKFLNNFSTGKCFQMIQY